MRARDDISSLHDQHAVFAFSLPSCLLPDKKRSERCGRGMTHPARMNSMQCLQAMDKRSEGGDGQAQQSMLYSGPRFVADAQNGVSYLTSPHLALLSLEDSVFQATTLEQHVWGCGVAAVYGIICHAVMTCG